MKLLVSIVSKCLNVRIYDCSRAEPSSISTTTTQIEDRITTHSATISAVPDTTPLTTGRGSLTKLLLIAITYPHNIS